MLITNARIIFSVALSLLAFLPSLTLQDRVRTSDDLFGQYDAVLNGPPGHAKRNGNNDFSGPPGLNKWERGPPNGPHGPPGLSRAPGLNGKLPPGLNKVDTNSAENEFTQRRPPGWNKGNIESSSKGENYPYNNPGSSGSTQKRPPGWNKGDTESSSKGENYPYNNPGSSGSIQNRPPGWNKGNTGGSSELENNPYDKGGSPQRRPGWNKGDVENSSEEIRPNNYPNSGGSTQRPQSDYNQGGPRGPDDRVTNDRDEYSQNGRCRNDEFRCRSNECLPQSVKCDNKIDCRDASDEESCIANRNQENGCILPEQPEGGRYELSDCGEPCTKRVGDIVPKNSILNFTCKSNYILSGNTISVCIDNDWYQPPSCHKVCSPLNSTSVDISCSYEGKTVSCSERIMPGTRATLACKSSYKLPLTNDPAYREITCLDDGLWDRRLFRCLPECGTSTARGNTLIVNGFEAEVGVFPWHVGIYTKDHRGEYEQICGGSLISNNLVVSAAHCFYDEVYNRLYNASKYAVAAGKHQRDWNAREKYAQQSLVESIQAGGRYQGARGNFAHDIALLKLKTPFELTTLIRPVCVDWDNMYEREQLQVGHAGKVVGWGKNIKGESTKTLQEIDMPFVPYDQCLSAVPVDFRGFLTSDKFCAGHLNGSSVCDGDSGGGLCFEKDNIWYLRGIVSVSPENRGTCDYNSYVGFTYVSHFRDWIREAYVNSTT